MVIVKVFRSLRFVTIVMLGASVETNLACAEEEFEPIFKIDYRDESFARRPLTQEQQEAIAHLSDIVIDKRQDWSDRKTAALELGKKYRHRACLPALLAVVRDEADHAEVRPYCAGALSYVPDRRTIAEFIELLLDKEFRVAYGAHDALLRLTRVGIGLGQFSDRDPESAERAQIHATWRRWWNKHSGTAQLDWSNVFYSTLGPPLGVRPYKPTDDEDSRK